MPDSNFFTFFMPKNDPFFDFWTPLIFDPIFFRHFTKNFAPEKISGLVPPMLMDLYIPSFLKCDSTLRIIFSLRIRSDLDFPTFGPTLLSGRRPEKKIGISLKFLHRKNQVWSPPPFLCTCKFPILEM